MKGKLVAILAVLFILAGIIFSISYKNGFNLNQTSNPMSEYDTIADLEKAVNFDFQVPAIVGNASNKKMFNYMGQMVEIQSDDIIFRAAPFIDYNADISGVYDNFSTDNKYISEDESVWVRYRLNEKNTIISLKIGDIAYSILFNKPINEEEAFEMAGINTSSLKPFIEDTEKVENKTDDKEDTNNTESKTDETSELMFRKYENSSLGISFMIPDVQSKVMEVDTENTVAVMLKNSAVFVIEYYKNGYKTEEFNGYTLQCIDENYLIRYVVNNPFDKGTQEYLDYYTLIENMDTIVSTFNHN